uniref:Uncharacterized protein n=1 Tax=Zea mays TaxID=4577 RepID=A0A804UC85_MAIZE
MHIASKSKRRKVGGARGLRALHLTNGCVVHSSASPSSIWLCRLQKSSSHGLPRLEVILGALCPVEHLLAGLEEDVLGVGQLARQPVEDLVEGVPRLRGLREQHRLLHGRVGQQPLLAEDLVHGDGREDGVQPQDVVLGHEHGDLLPRDG